MTEAGREARRAYQREYSKAWRRAHPDRVRAIQARYWERLAARKAEEAGEDVSDNAERE